MDNTVQYLKLQISMKQLEAVKEYVEKKKCVTYGSFLESSFYNICKSRQEKNKRALKRIDSLAHQKAKDAELDVILKRAPYPVCVLCSFGKELAKKGKMSSFPEGIKIKKLEDFYPDKELPDIVVGKIRYTAKEVKEIPKKLKNLGWVSRPKALKTRELKRVYTLGGKPSKGFYVVKGSKSYLYSPILK